MGCKYRAKRNFQAILHKIFNYCMNILLKQVLINDPHSPYHGQVQDILIVDNKIQKIGAQLTTDNATIVQEDGLEISAGWVDCFAHFGDPGFEFNETFASGAAAAAAAGYTRHLPVTIHPQGAITQKTEGKELAEMYDMRNSGAIAFTDGLSPVQSAGL